LLIICICTTVAGLCLHLMLDDGLAEGISMTNSASHAFASVPIFLLSFFTHLSFIPVFIELTNEAAKHLPEPPALILSPEVCRGRPPIEGVHSASPCSPKLPPDMECPASPVSPSSVRSVVLYDSEGQLACRQQAAATLRFVVHAAVAAVFGLYAAVGMLGYLACGPTVPSDILTYFTSKWFNVVRFCYGLSVLFAFPILVVVARRGLEDLLWKEEASRPVRIVETAVLVVIAATVSILEPNLGVVFGITGAVTGFFLAWILPGAIHLCLSEERWYSNSKNLAAAGLMALGILGLTAGTFLYAAVEVFKVLD